MVRFPGGRRHTIDGRRRPNGRGCALRFARPGGGPRLERAPCPALSRATCPLMCLILFGHRAHPEYRLVLAANRDEFHARPTAPLAEWADAPGVFGGRDLQAGGTWLAGTATGRGASCTYDSVHPGNW